MFMVFFHSRVMNTLLYHILMEGQFTRSMVSSNPSRKLSNLLVVILRLRTQVVFHLRLFYNPPCLRRRRTQLILIPIITLVSTWHEMSSRFDVDAGRNERRALCSCSRPNLLGRS